MIYIYIYIYILLTKLCIYLKNVKLKLNIINYFLFLILLLAFEPCNTYFLDPSFSAVSGVCIVCIHAQVTKATLGRERKKGKIS